MNSFSLEYDIKKPSSYNQNTKVILMFHGYGSNKSDLFSFSNFMDSDYLIISIQAPIKLDYNSYCWWSLQYDDNMRLTMNAEEALKTVNQLNEFISTDLCEKYNFISDQIYLVGFSQGCMISYTLSINYPKKYKKVIGLSGKIPYEILKYDEKEDYTDHNFFCSHGIYDQVIPIEIGRESDKWLSKNKISHKYLEFDSAHGINAENFEQMTHWLNKN